MILKNSIKTRK